MSSAMTNPTSGPINRAATFHPAGSDDAVPAIEVAGVLVSVYVDDTGTLRVSLDFDTADENVFGIDADGEPKAVPVQVTLGGQPVYRIDEFGDERYGNDAALSTDDESAELLRSLPPVGSAKYLARDYT